MLAHLTRKTSRSETAIKQASKCFGRGRTRIKTYHKNGTANTKAKKKIVTSQNKTQAQLLHSHQAKNNSFQIRSVHDALHICRQNSFTSKLKPK